MSVVKNEVQPKPEVGDVVELRTEEGEWLIIYADLCYERPGENKFFPDSKFEGWAGWTRFKNLKTMVAAMGFPAAIEKTIRHVDIDQPMEALIKELGLPMATIFRQNNLPCDFLDGMTTDDLIAVDRATTSGGNGFDDKLCAKIARILKKRGVVNPPAKPQSLTPGWVKDTCKLGTGFEKTCAYIDATGDSIACSKTSDPEFAKIIGYRLTMEPERMTAKGNNCGGCYGTVKLNEITQS